MIKRAVRAIQRTWESRRSARAEVRIAWWAAALGILTLLLLFEPGRLAALTIWSVGNLVLACAVTGWSLFHPRSVWRARETVFLWAFTISLPATLGIAAALDPALAERSRAITLPTSSLLGIVTLVTWPLMFGFLLTCGLFGAAIGAFGARRTAGGEEAARASVGAWWMAVLGVTMAVAALPDRSGADLLAAALIVGLPVIALLLLQVVLRRSFASRSLAQRFVAALNRYLRIRITWRSRRFTIDLRGAALGAAAAGGLLGIQAIGLLAPLEAWMLVSLMQTRAAIHMIDPTGQMQIRLSGRRDGPAGAPSSRDASREATVRGMLVLLEMDAETRRQILTSSSEAEMQARVISRLAKWGVRRIVLPMPDFAAHGIGLSGRAQAVLGVETPLPDRDDIHRSERRLPLLAAAMRSAGDVVLAVNAQAVAAAGAEGRPYLATLERAAAGTADADLPPFHTARLPSIAPSDSPFPPLPALLASAVRGVAPTVENHPGHHRVEIAGIEVPTIVRDRVLVDFQGSGTETPFAHDTYESVLHGAPVYNGGQRVTGDQASEWEDAPDYFKDKIVYLDSMVPTLHETPLGPMPESELLANATTTVLAATAIQGFSLGEIWLPIVLLGAVVGSLCTNKTPLLALWRVAAVLFLTVVAAMIAFHAFALWIDPVLPVCVSAAAFLLAAHITFAMEHRDREATRQLLQRFVAPQVVDELLDEPEKLGLGGTRRNVCVLFADVRNFTGYSESHTPEEVIEVVNDYMTVLTDALDAHGGILDKYTGDGLMAIFPISDPREGVPRAVRAALAMSRAAEELSTRRIAHGKEPLHVGIGVHYGEAVVGMVGNPVRQINYTALGHTVVVSARLQTLAAGGEVVVSDAVYLETAGAFSMRGGDPVHVKGVTEPVRPYRVLPAAPAEALTIEHAEPA